MTRPRGRGKQCGCIRDPSVACHRGYHSRPTGVNVTKKNASLALAACLAPLDADGRSADWVVKWASKSAGKINLMSVKNGAVTTYEMASAGGREIVLSPQSILESKKLVAMADAQG